MNRFSQLYALYDRFMTFANMPARFCSQCEKKVRFWVYHFGGLTHCQECADAHVADLQDQSEIFKSL